MGLIIVILVTSERVRMDATGTQCNLRIKYGRSAVFIGGSDIHSPAELNRSVKIDGTVVLPPLGISYSPGREVLMHSIHYECTAHAQHICMNIH